MTDKKWINVEMEGLTISTWCPSPDAIGTPEQVHIRIQIAPELEIIVRLKSRRATDELIAALENHRDEVWPEPEPSFEER